MTRSLNHSIPCRYPLSSILYPRVCFRILGTMTSNPTSQSRFGGTFVALSIMMFLEFFIWGAWYVTMSTFMTEAGMASKIGLAYMLCPLAAIISPFFLGMVADRYFASERVLAVLQIIS